MGYRLVFVWTKLDGRNPQDEQVATPCVGRWAEVLQEAAGYLVGDSVGGWRVGGAPQPAPLLLREESS